MIGLVDGNNFFVSCERVFNRRLVGKPVAVLSNNDGCCVSRSNEFKALGIPMGTPYFQLRERERTGELMFCSSNYELYGDISRRIISILREETLEVEQYSIDEAFIHPPQGGEINLMEYGTRLRAKILRWVGIPCGIGFAPTKTLAKIANHLAKKQPEGVFILPDDPTPVLATLPAEEVWGVGRRLSAKLHTHGIHTAEQLRNAPKERIRSVGGITLLRTVEELRGIPCTEEWEYVADPDSVSCSRSFGTPVTTREGIAESLASFITEAAAKLRRHGMLAAGCNIYAQTFQSGGGGEFIERTVVFHAPTDATNEMLTAVSPNLDALFVPGFRYRKTGVVFFGLEKVGTARQLDLFTASAPSEASPLFQAIDKINARYGRNRVFSASLGIGEASWKMKREKLSKRSTTRWDELITVR
ncbi:MAG: Y-family DNA polymerase [Kiritimatiellae bacterium]|nr:Y-family DNA polymerase [Kiritimatiellia bacterium]